MIKPYWLNIDPGTSPTRAPKIKHPPLEIKHNRAKLATTKNLQKGTTFENQVLPSYFQWFPLIWARL